MPIKIFRRPGSKIWNYRGTVAGRRLRGSTGTTDKARAQRIAAKKETSKWDGHLDGPGAVLTFAKAALLYRAAGKETKFLPKIEDYWKDTLVKDMTAGSIRQSAVDLYPTASGATRNRHVITPTQAVINHCSELDYCSPVRIKRFKFERKIKKPITVTWLDTFCAHARPLSVALVTTMFATACRINEAMRLEWADIDFTNRTILIRDSKTQKQRIARMPPRLLVALANLPRDDAWPFGGWSESSLRRFWEEDVEATAKAVAGFERLTFHSCRHGFATKLLRDGVDPKTAAAMGGWDDVALFLNTYAHAIEDTRIVDNIFGTELTQAEMKANKNKGIG